MPSPFRTAHLRRLARRGVSPTPPPPPPPPAPPILSIGPASVTHDEGNTGTTAFVFTVTRFGNLDVQASVSWSAAGVGASPASPADFSGATSGAVTLAPGVPSATITVLVAGDAVVEDSEQFAVTLSAPVNCTLGTAVAYGVITNDDSVTPPPPPPPPPSGDAPAWVSDTTLFDDYVVRLGWVDPNDNQRWKVLPPLAGETLCPGFTAGAAIDAITSFNNTSMTMIPRIIGIVYKNITWPKGVTFHLPPGTLKLRRTTYDSVGSRVNIRFIGSARAKTWMTDGISDGTHIDFGEATAGMYVNNEGVIRFDNITWRRQPGASVSKHVFESSCIYRGCFQFVGCEFRWAADAVKLHEAQTNDKKNYALAGGWGGANEQIWTPKGIRKETGTSLWLYDCVVRECGGQDSGLKHGLIYALNGNALRLDKVAVIDTTKGYLGAKAGINVIHAEKCLFANRWNTYSYGRRLDANFVNNNPSRYWGDTLLEPQPGAAEILLKDTQFWARAEQKYDVINFGATPANGAAITLNGFTVTFVTGTPGANQVLIGASTSATVNNLAAMLRASTSPVAQAFDYEVYGSGLIITGKRLPKAVPSFAATTQPAANATLVAGGQWSGAPQAFIYEHLRGKMPFANGGKLPDYLIREWPGTNGSWRGIWWNNGQPVTAGDPVAMAGTMTAFVWRDLTPTTHNGFGSCAFNGASGSWPSLALATFTNGGWSFHQGAGVLANNRGRVSGTAQALALTGDVIPDAVTVTCDLAAIPNTDDGHGVVVKANAANAWAPATAYAENARAESGGNLYNRKWMASAPAASGTVAPTGTGTSISDGAYLWDYVGPASHYALTYHRASGQLKIAKRLGTTTVLAQATVGSVASARLRFEAIDGQLKGRLWAIGGAEPTTWAVTASDASVIPEGKVGLTGKSTTTEFLEFDNLAVDSPYVGRVLRCNKDKDGTSAPDMQFSWPPADTENLKRLGAPYTATHYWRAWVTIQDADGNQGVHESLASCDGRTRCTLATAIPTGFIAPAGTRVHLAPATRAFRDVRLLNPAYHNPADPNYYWNKLYRGDGTLKQPGDAGFAEAFHVRYVDNCTFTYVGPSQTIGGEAPAILKYNTAAYCAYLAAKDNEGYLAMPPQWNATCSWSRPTGAGTFTDGAETGNRFFGGTAPTGFRGHQGSDFTDPVTWMFRDTSHYCLPSEFRGGQANPRTHFQTFDDPDGAPANGQTAPRGRVFVVDKTTGALTQGGQRPTTTLTTLTQAGAKGATTVRVASTSGMAVGHKIEIALANDPWGLTQADDPVTGRIKPYADTHVWRHVTRIVAVSGQTVTLADPLPDPFPGDGLTDIAAAGAWVATTPSFPRPGHFITRFEDLPTATQDWTPT